MKEAPTPTIVEMLVEGAFARSKRLKQLKSSLNELATSVNELAMSLNRLANVVNEHAVHLKRQGEINESNKEALKDIHEGMVTTASTIDAMQEYMDVSIVCDDPNGEATFPQGLFSMGEGEDQGGMN